jgi:hypothetical protein
MAASKGTDEALFVSNRGRFACPKHGGAYFTAHLMAHPRARFFITPLDAWTRIRAADRELWLAETGTPMRCEDCPPPGGAAR